ncbi:MAG: DUF2141 domain-containing protein [Acidobacteriota bacterium]|nr:DUF2141 domain-containing protein [Acidobacteriota bacterium]
MSSSRVFLSEEGRPLPGYNAPMTSLRQRIAFVLLAVALSACTSAPPGTPEPRPTGHGRVEVTMTGFKNDEGTAHVAFFLDARVWPDGDGSIFATAVVPISDGRASAVFEDVPAGPFAVSVFHDENDNGELDSVALGIPSEAYGFSADARDLFGPPSFEEARINLAAGESKQIAIRVK